MYKKLLSFLLLFMISCSLLLSACSSSSDDEMIDGYISYCKSQHTA